MMKNFLALFVAFCFIFIGSVFSVDNNPLTVTILYDNYIFTEGTQADWGFSCLIKGTEKTILFDTGTKPDILLHNVKILKVNLKEIELVALSHIHGDHTGGLSAFLKENSKVSVYVPISFPDEFNKGVEATGAKIVSVDKPVAICKGVFSTGEMGTAIKEHGLILDTEKGLVFITGCAHPGIVGMVQRAKEVLDKNIYMVFGGFHLMQKSDAEMKEIIRQFKEMGVLKVGATHCTGEHQIDLFRKAYGENFVQMGVGRVIEISK